MKRLVVVLGMHRSGTSAIARGLRALGIDLGERLMPAAAGNNERGFWEDIDVNQLDTEVLAAMGRTWDTLEPLRASDFAAVDLQPFRARAAALLRERLAATAAFGLKDPRISLLLPFWKPVFAELGVDVSYVVSVRHALSVARSLEKRDGFELLKGHYLWLAHTAAAVLGTAGERRVLLDYDRLMAAPEAELRRLAAALGFTLSPGALDEYRRDFLSEDLRHTRYGAEDLARAPDVPADVRVASELLEALTTDRRSPSEPAVAQFFSAVLERLEAQRTHLACMSRRDAIITQQKARLLHLDDLERRVAEAETRVHQRNLELQEANARIVAASAEVAAIDADRQRAKAMTEFVAGQAAERLAARIAAAERLAEAIERLDPEARGHAALKRLAEAAARYAADARKVAHPSEAQGAEMLVWRAAEQAAQSAAATWRELEIARLRVVDALREGDRERSHTGTVIAHIEGELHARERVLAQPGHQLVTRVGRTVDRHPVLRTFATAPVRFLHWIFHARA